MIRVAVIDDHPHVAIAMRALLHATPDIRLVAESNQGTTVFALVQQARPDLLFLDLMMEAGYDALTTVRELRRQFPHLKLCVLSAFMEPTYVRDLVQAGIQGYILKDDDYVTQLEAIIRNLMTGQLYLSQQAYAGLAQATQQGGAAAVLNERERAILQLAARGLPNPEIAQALHLAPGTVRNHLSAIYEKFNVRNRQEAILLAQERRLI